MGGEMKRYFVHFLKTFFLCALTFSLFLTLTACKDDERPNGPENGEDPDETETAELTDGVFYVGVPGYDRKQLIKFKTDGTFYAIGLYGDVIAGKYEVVDMEIEYRLAGTNGNWENPEAEDSEADGDSVEVLISSKAIKFYHLDGSVMQDMRNDNYEGQSTLNEGIDSCYVAWTEGYIHMLKIGQTTRTVKHDPEYYWSEEDEEPIVLFKFMIKEVPEELADEFEQTELTFTIYHNGYKNALGVKEVNGTYTIEDGVYVLSKGGTFRIGEDGQTAVYEDDEVTIECVVYAEPNEKLVATLTTAHGQKCELYNDHTCSIEGSLFGTWSWSMATYTLTITIEGFEPAYSDIGKLAEGVLSITLPLTDTVSLEFTAPATVVGDLNAVPEGPQEVATLECEYPQVEAVLVLYDDHSCAIVENGEALSTGTWSFANYQLTVEINGESATSSGEDLQAGKLKVSISMDGFPVPFSCDASIVADLMAME